MKDSHKHSEELLKSIILSGPLQRIRFFQVNDSFFELSDEGYWIIDTGIELKFPSGIISAVWNTELDSYVLKNDPLESIYKQNNLYQLNTENIASLKKYVGLNVLDVNFKSQEFEYIIDYTMRTKKEKRFVEVILHFQNKLQLQIAFVNYTLDEKSSPKDFSFDITTELLISTKKIMEIKNID